jgi:hypothetical protein
LTFYGRQKFHPARELFVLGTTASAFSGRAAFQRLISAFFSDRLKTRARFVVYRCQQE